MWRGRFRESFYLGLRQLLKEFHRLGLVLKLRLEEWVVVALFQETMEPRHFCLLLLIWWRFRLGDPLLWPSIWLLRLGIQLRGCSVFPY